MNGQTRVAAPGTSTGTGIGLAIECATERVEVLVRGPEAAARARAAETVGHGHTRRVTAILAEALEQAGVRPSDLEWVAVDLGPGSFTGVRVGLATAHGLALASGVRVAGASSLAALALGTPARRSLIVPLVPAGRRDAYAGFFRADARGAVRRVAAPRVLALEGLLEAIRETCGAAGLDAVRCPGPGAARWREAIEQAFPLATAGAWRHEGLSAEDLANAATSNAGPAAGLPPPGRELQPVYVRSAQAEERVRHVTCAADPASLRPMEERDLLAVAAIEREVFSDPWPEAFFLGELAQRFAHARVAERGGQIEGYSVAWLGAASGHLGNLAVVPGARRRGVATALLADLLEQALVLGVEALTLEVRVSNDAAQALYRAHGFRLAGLRRGYYRDTGEDALVMAWRNERKGFDVLAQA